MWAPHISIPELYGAVHDKDDAKCPHRFASLVQSSSCQQRCEQDALSFDWSHTPLKYGGWLLWGSPRNIAECAEEDEQD
eukprot:scaffold1603_cov415-Prasinococcus_capsulatus_cf.AAC.7